MKKQIKNQKKIKKNKKSKEKITNDGVHQNVPNPWGKERAQKSIGTSS